MSDQHDEEYFRTMEMIGGILFRRLHGTPTAEDEAVLEAWLNAHPEQRRIVEEMGDRDRIQAELASMYKWDEAAALANVQKKIERETVAEAIIRPIFAEKETNRRKWYRYSIVAALLVLLGGSIVLVVKSRHREQAISPPVVQHSLPNDVAPGGDKAVLELADGSKILLDDAATGELAKQGRTSVRKVAGGKLAYLAEGSAGSEPVSYNLVTTPRGGQFQVDLPDGSKAWLNNASSLRFPTAFSGDSREVELTGEAYFEIAANADRPFKVLVHRGSQPATEVRVLGTSFNISAYSEESELRTTLVNGAVEVGEGGRQAVLKPGQQARIRKSSEAIQVVRDVDIEGAIAWRKGYFHFEKADIQTVMRQLARWYDIDVEFEGPQTNHVFMGDIERNIPLSQVLKYWENDTEVKVKILEGKKVVVRR